MGIRRNRLFFFILSWFLHISSSISLSQTDFVSAYVQEKNTASERISFEVSMRGGNENVVQLNRRSGSSSGGHGGESFVNHASGSGGGGRGSIGGRPDSGGTGVDGGTSPYTPATTKVIPLYGAGAAARHKSSANCYGRRVGLAALIVAILPFLVSLF